MLDIGVPELIIILVIMLVVFGPGRIAGAGRALGQSIRDFRTAVGAGSEETKPAESQELR